MAKIGNKGTRNNVQNNIKDKDAIKIITSGYFFAHAKPFLTTNVFLLAILSFSISRILFKFKTATLKRPIAIAGKINFQSNVLVNKKFEPKTETNPKKIKTNTSPKPIYP